MVIIREDGSRQASARVLSLVLLFCLSWMSKFTVASVHPHRQTLDLSYLHNIPADKVASVLQDRIMRQNEGDVVSIDLSFSFLGDSGFRNILNAMLPMNTTAQGPNVREEATPKESFIDLHLSCRMNDLTPLSAKAFLERMIAVDQTKINIDMPKRRVSVLDLGWNHLSTDELGGNDNFHHLLEQVIIQQQQLNLFSLEQCGLGPAKCRALAKGILGRLSQAQRNDCSPLSLRLARNPWVGDAGTAAFAAAIRSLAMEYAEASDETKPEHEGLVLLDTLDLSGCGISDVGVQALALALEDIPHGCIAFRHLNLAHNKITEQGATALSRALLLCGSRNAICSSLDLSHNHLEDRGAASLSVVLEQGRIRNLILRSCHIHADGGAAIGKALYSLTTKKKKLIGSDQVVSLDLSGNPLGMLRGKSKSPGGGGKYSASRLKSTATATAASYMNQIKKGWKNSGVADLLGGASGGGVDSDDEEAQGEVGSDNEEEEESKKRCGIKALTNAFLGTETETKNNDSDDIPESEGDDGVPTTKYQKRLHVNLGLRQTFLDHGAADALAALVVEASRQRNVQVTLDLAMNPVLEEEMVDALEGHSLLEDEDDALLGEMAERYMDLWQAIRESKQRAAQARARVRETLKRRREEEDAWGSLDHNKDDDNDMFDNRRRRKREEPSETYFDDDEDDTMLHDDEDEPYNDECDQNVEDDDLYDTN